MALKGQKGTTNPIQAISCHKLLRPLVSELMVDGYPLDKLATRSEADPRSPLVEVGSYGGHGFELRQVKTARMLRLPDSVPNKPEGWKPPKA